MNQKKSDALSQPVINKERPSVGRTPASASNGFNQFNGNKGKQYGVNAVPTSRKA